jgi:hypothetical protein
MTRHVQAQSCFRLACFRRGRITRLEIPSSAAGQASSISLLLSCGFWAWFSGSNPGRDVRSVPVQDSLSEVVSAGPTKASEQGDVVGD